ncbi:uncharacterized protein FTOL_03863 [Fusarium torulosum]|uniref:Uncharacterized protein n=1 Tax=Fusarium torulosum TaxID=33205 RepID=A0AAE8M4N5_9HYPO|nr:uncharacterized protein FTOL_03863 [Fusarium torulosum]
MTSALWDPEHLLQITHGTRDRWDIDEPNRSKIRPLLDLMSQTLPESITTDTLRHLARLCLCSSYHSHQVETFVSDWQTVINTTVQCNRRMTQAQAAEAESQLSVATAEVLHLEESLDTLRYDYAEIQTRLELVATESDEKIAKLNKVAQDNEAEHAATELSFREMISSQETWKDQAAEELESRTKAEEENAVLQARLEKVNGQLRDFESVQEENNELKEQISLLAEEFKGAKRAVDDETKKANDVEQQRADERALAQSMMDQYKAQLDQERSHCAVLRGRIECLELVVTEMEDDILSCWSHKFWGWMAKVGKGGASKLRMGSQKETTREIALKTYA